MRAGPSLRAREREHTQPRAQVVVLTTVRPVLVLMCAMASGVVGT